MDAGLTATVWAARVSAGLYVLALILIVRNEQERARVAWAAGLTVYLVHVWFAFTYLYDWSHSRAYYETARQTDALFGVNWGGGLYLNYLFTGIWLADCLWSWASARSYQSRPAWIGWTIHMFMGFMFANATVVVWLLRSFPIT